MMTALKWFALLGGAYSAISLIWVFVQSRHSGAGTTSARPSQWPALFQRNSLSALIILGSGAFIVMPNFIYHYGIWGLFWTGLLLIILLYAFRFLGSEKSPENAPVTIGLYPINKHYGFFWGVGRLVWIVVIVLLLAWQLNVAHEMIRILGPSVLPSTYIILALALFLLITVTLAGDKIIIALSRVKMLVLAVVLCGVSMVLYAYLGGAGSVLSVIKQIYSTPKSSSIPLASWKTLTPVNGVILIADAVLSLIFSFLVLVMFKQTTAFFTGSEKGRRAKVEKPPSKGQAVSQMILFLTVSTLFGAYCLLLGFGAHFLGADSLVNELSAAKSGQLFEAAPRTRQAPNILILLLKSLAPIIPFMTALFTAFMVIILLSTSQIFLFHLGQTASRLIVRPVLRADVTDRQGFMMFQRKALLWQHRSYALILMMVMILSQSALF